MKNKIIIALSITSLLNFTINSFTRRADLFSTASPEKISNLSDKIIQNPSVVATPQKINISVPNTTVKPEMPQQTIHHVSMQENPLTEEIPLEEPTTQHSDSPI